MKSIWIGKELEVVDILPKLKLILLIHHTYKPYQQLELPKFKGITEDLRDKVFDYLADEGFIERKIGWRISLTVIKHVDKQ